MLWVFRLTLFLPLLLQLMFCGNREKFVYTKKFNEEKNKYCLVVFLCPLRLFFTCAIKADEKWVSLNCQWVIEGLSQFWFAWRNLFILQLSFEQIECLRALKLFPRLIICSYSAGLNFSRSTVSDFLGKRTAIVYTLAGNAVRTVSRIFCSTIFRLNKCFFMSLI